jgi:hypothetical protein
VYNQLEVATRLFGATQILQMEQGEPMTNDATSVPASQTSPTETIKPARVWPAVVLVGLYWAVDLAVGSMEISMFAGFMMRMAALALVVLLFIVWWLSNGRISRTDRLSLFAAAIATGAITISLSHSTVIGPSVFFLAVPVLLTAWTIWLAVARRMSPRVRRIGLLATLLLTWVPATLIRMEGLAGDGNAQIEGKTWNHPVIAHGRPYVRNAEEMACYEVGFDETDSP